jgi:pimeloyl-ACP methyl ester carboxylesterase
MGKRVPAKVKIVRFFWLSLAAVFVLLIGTSAAVALLTYRITHPPAAAELVTPEHFLMPSENLSWVSDDGYRFEGYWIPGEAGAPGIVLSPGHGMSRSAVLSLAAQLRSRGFHSLVYEQRGSGAAPRGHSTLGLLETNDLLAAIDQLRDRRGVDQEYAGVWGADIGARAALAAAAFRKQVKVIVADSAYDSVGDFLDTEVRETSGMKNRLVEFLCRQGFLAYQLASPGSLKKRLPLTDLGNRKILFIAGENRSSMAQLTRSLFEEMQPRQDMTTLATARTRIMSGADLAIYDRAVADYFGQHLNLFRARTDPGRKTSEMRPSGKNGADRPE